MFDSNHVAAVSFHTKVFDIFDGSKLVIDHHVITFCIHSCKQAIFIRLYRTFLFRIRDGTHALMIKMPKSKLCILNILVRPVFPYINHFNGLEHGIRKFNFVGLDHVKERFTHLGWKSPV